MTFFVLSLVLAACVHVNNVQQLRWEPGPEAAAWVSGWDSVWIRLGFGLDLQAEVAGNRRRHLFIAATRGFL